MRDFARINLPRPKIWYDSNTIKYFTYKRKKDLIKKKKDNSNTLQKEKAISEDLFIGWFG